MRYQLEQKIWSWTHSFEIFDAEGNPAYHVDGSFSLKHRLAVEDLDGAECARIEQKIWNWAPTYEITRDGRVVAQVKKKVFSWRDRFVVDVVSGGHDLEVEGDWRAHEYVFRRGDHELAQVSKRYFSWSDTYGVDIAEGADDVLILATVVVIDLVSHTGSHD